MNKDFAKNVWNKLVKIDVSEYIQKKGNLNYLSWAWAWGELMKHYPSSTYSFRTVDEGLRAEVWCDLIITDGDDFFTRSMWLPVMDYKNNPIPNPTSRDISDTRMRCLVKTIAMFGLGHYIYAGEDLPEAKSKEEIAQDKINYSLSLLNETLLNDYTYMKEALDAGDDPVVHECWMAIGAHENQTLVWHCFGSKQRAHMKKSFEVEKSRLVEASQCDLGDSN